MLEKLGHGDVDGDEAASEWIDAQSEAFKGHGSQEGEGGFVAEDDQGGGLSAIHDKLGPADRATPTPAVREDHGPPIEWGDPQGFQ